MAAKLRFSCVAALEPARGIGKDGTLPWRLRGDMKFFAKLTSEVKTEGKQNAVIMGRKTWDSIPAKFRPLPKRLNIVLSKSLSTAPDGADHLCSSLESAIEVLSKQPLSDGIEQIFIIGGGSVYKEAMEHPSCYRLYLTHVMKDFDCDAFFPNFDQNIFVPISIPEVADEIQEEKGIQYKFQVYERQNSNHSNGV